MPRFDAIGLVVQDMASTVSFYRRVGLDFSPGAEGEQHVEVDAGGIRLMFDTIELVRSFSDWTEPAGGHRVALAFLCHEPGEVDRLHRDLVASGHRSHVEPFDAPWGQRYATVLDPDGNPVDLFAPMA